MHRIRSAEQRWPALSNADTSASATTLFRQRRAVDDHGILATGLGDQHRIVVTFRAVVARCFAQRPSTR
jgi:hypothetical protein